MALAEPHRYVIDQLRHLKTFQLPVAAMQRNQFFRLVHLFCRSRGNETQIIFRDSLPRHLRCSFHDFDFGWGEGVKVIDPGVRAVMLKAEG